MFELDSTSKGNLTQFANHSIILQYHDFGEDITWSREDTFLFKCPHLTLSLP